MTDIRGTSVNHERHVRDGVTALYCPWCGTWPPMDPDPRYHASVVDPELLPRAPRRRATAYVLLALSWIVALVLVGLAVWWWVR